MGRYHKVLGGEIVETRDFAEGETPPALAANKGVWLPEIVAGYEPFDPVSEVRSGPVQTIEETAVVQLYTVRDKNTDEVGAMVESKVALLEAEYRRRNAEPFTATVDGVERTWHGDAEGMSNVEGINILIARDPESVPNPRPWKPYEADIITVSHDGFLAIGAAFASRKDANFSALQTQKATVRAMTDPADVEGFDPLEGWG